MDSLLDVLTTLARTTAEERGRLLGMGLGGIAAIIVGFFILKNKNKQKGK